MKKIGFVDYYISEWHANNYPGWIKQANERLGLDFQVCYAWAKEELSPVDNVTTDRWCEKMGITRCDTVEELCEKSDYIIILAPSNPETHLELANAVLPFGKRTYIDKTFAPDLAIAEEIFALSRKYNTPFFSTSALRFASELKEFEKANNLVIKGGGSNLEEYIIHTVEIAATLLKEGVGSVKVKRSGEDAVGNVITKTGRTATLEFSPANDFSVSGTLPDGSVKEMNISSNFFDVLMEGILKFFSTGEKPFDEKETLEAMALRDAFLSVNNK